MQYKTLLVFLFFNTSTNAQIKVTKVAILPIIPTQHQKTVSQMRNRSTVGGLNQPNQLTKPYLYIFLLLSLVMCSFFTFVFRVTLKRFFVFFASLFRL